MKNPAVEELLSQVYTRSPELIHNSAVRNVYGFSNENLRDFFMHLNINNGRVATVGSSGDQMLNAVYSGASEVTLIDANPYAKPIVELKKSAIENMTYQEFMNYWQTGEILKKRNYHDLLHGVSDETRDFLEQFEKYANGKFFPVAEGEIIDHASFSMFGSGKDACHEMCYSIGSPFYDNEKKFNILKNKLQNCKINYEFAEYSSFPEVLEGEYSSILVSNIYNYYPDTELFFSIAKCLIDKNLTKDGTMQMHYKLGRYTLFRENYGLYMDGYDRCKEYIVKPLSSLKLSDSKMNSDGLINEFVRRFEHGPKVETDDLHTQHAVFIYEKE